MAQCPPGLYPYIIRPGDSLWLIARRFNTTIQEIESANPGLDANNLKIGQTICIKRRKFQMYAQANANGTNKTALTLSNRMRLLWEQHIYWTVIFILSMAFGSPNNEAVTNRLLRNPKDFEAALRTFYGGDFASKFSELFTEHLVIAAELVQAAIDNNSAAVDDADKRWYENADEIAAFFGSINPYWSEQEWKKMLYDHLDMTKTEAVDLIDNNYTDSINTIDNIEQQALAMADMMTEGIVKQFPQYFR